MGQNFLSCDRDQELLLPPSLREWLPDGHLAWFVLDAVEQMDLTAFYADYRDDGERPRHEDRGAQAWGEQVLNGASDEREIPTPVRPPRRRQIPLLVYDLRGMPPTGFEFVLPP